MTISTHTRVERGYYRRYYAANADELRPPQRVRRLCRYRLGCALQLLEELREFWREEKEREEREARMPIRLTPPSLVISQGWTNCANDGVSSVSTGRSVLRIRSTG
jgi:hypothetical protein